MRPISPGDGYVCLLDSKRPVFRWQLAMVIQASIHAYLEDGNELFLHCCMRMAGPWWRWRQNLTGGVSCACVCVCVWTTIPIHPFAGLEILFLDSSPPPSYTQTYPVETQPHHILSTCQLPKDCSLRLRDCLCVLWLFTVKWPLVLLMALNVVIIMPF